LSYFGDSVEIASGESGSHYPYAEHSTVSFLQLRTSMSVMWQLK